MAANAPSSAPTAEAGDTTSEYQLSVGAAATSGVGLLVTLVSNHAHWFTADDISAIRLFLGAIATLAVGYALSRGIRKSGTQG